MRIVLSNAHLPILLIAGFLSSTSRPAEAQLNNQPFSFQRGGPANGVGMSGAYRQILLERKLSGRSTANNFIRGIDGSLVNVERRGDQAFGRPQTAPYIAASGFFASGSDRFGFNDGSISRGAGGLLSIPSSAAGDDMPAIYGPAAGAVPINSWIQLLANLPELAS